MDSCIKEMKSSHQIQLEELKSKYEGKLARYQDKVKRLEITRQENLSIILQKEGSIRLLQEKIKAEENQKDIQLDHADVLCQMSNKIMSMLDKMDNKLPQNK